jgi:hypothetical protein
MTFSANFPSPFSRASDQDLTEECLCAFALGVCKPLLVCFPHDHPESGSFDFFVSTDYFE